MGVDEEIKHRLQRSLLVVESPSVPVDQVIRRGWRLRRRHRTIGYALAAVALVAVAAPLALLSPLGAHRPGSQIAPEIKPSRLVVAAQVPLDPGITDVAVADGGVWVTGASGVTRVDAVTNRIVAHIPVSGTGDSSSIAVGEGSVWVTAPELRPGGSRGNLIRIDPVTNRIVATIHVGGPIQGVAAGGGSVWVTRPASGPGRVFRIDPTSNRVLGSAEVGEGPGPVVFVAGFVWITNTVFGGSVTKIDPTTGREVATLAVPSVQAVADGSLWGVASDAVLRIDPVSGRIQATIHIPRAEMVAAAGSTVWVLVSPRSSDPALFYPIKGTAALERVDPTTNHVTGKSLPIDDLQPIALAAGNQTAWVADYISGTLSRVAALPCESTC